MRVTLRFETVSILPGTCTSLDEIRKQWYEQVNLWAVYFYLNICRCDTYSRNTQFWLWNNELRHYFKISDPEIVQMGKHRRMRKISDANKNQNQGRCLGISYLRAIVCDFLWREGHKVISKPLIFGYWAHVYLQGMNANYLHRPGEFTTFPFPSCKLLDMKLLDGKISLEWGV